MLFDDTYKTISFPTEGSFIDRGSRFMGYGYPVTNEQQIKDIISQVRAQHPKARHHCWAFRLTPDRTIFRINDDGEPSGTAGRPILNTLLSFDVTNILVVVVRYFGGTLLGVPGLINAYKSATVQTMNAAQIVEKSIDDVYRIEFGYPVMNQIMKVIKQNGLKIIRQQQDTTCAIEVFIPKPSVNQTINEFSKIKGASLLYLYTV